MLFSGLHVNHGACSAGKLLWTLSAVVLSAIAVMLHMITASILPVRELVMRVRQPARAMGMRWNPCVALGCVMAVAGP